MNIPITNMSTGAHHVLCSEQAKMFFKTILNCVILSIIQVEVLLRIITASELLPRDKPGSGQEILALAEKHKNLRKPQWTDKHTLEAHMPYMPNHGPMHQNFYQT